MTERIVNLGATTLAAGIPSTSSGSSEVITVTSVPSGASEPVFRVNLGGGELGKVTAVSGISWTVERGAEGTTPLAHSKGQEVLCVITAGTFESVVTGSLINAAHYATGGVVNMTNLVKAMEEERKGAYFPESLTMGEQVLLNKTHVASPSTFQYAFYGLGGTRVKVTLPVMASGQFAFRANENAEGVKEGESLYNHPDVIFENIEFVGSGSADGGSVCSAYNRTYRIVNVQCKSLANGFVNKGFSDLTYIDDLTGDQTVTGWLWQGENGDGQQIHGVQAYGGKGISVKHGSGTVSGLVSGEHKFVVGKWLIVDDHLEGDGPNVEHGKAQNPLITLEGGDYLVKGCRLYTLHEPARPCVKVIDNAERFTLLRFENTRFLQRLGESSGPVEPVGDIQGIALELENLSTKSVVQFVDTHAETYQQTSEESRFDERAILGFRVTGGEPGTKLTERRVMIASLDSELRYNANTPAWEVRPIAGDMLVTRRFGRPAIETNKYAAGSAQAKAAPTTRGTGKHYYEMCAYDDRGRRTNISPEALVELTSGQVPALTLKAGYPCRVVLWHGTTAGMFTEWVELVLPRGQAVLADMGNAIGGQEWKSTSVPTPPGTGEAENSTAAGLVLLENSPLLRNISFVKAVFTTGEWQQEGDLLYIAAQPYICAAAATGNNGGTWRPLPNGTNELESGESTVPREAINTTSSSKAGIELKTERLWLAFFTAKKTETVEHLRVACLEAAEASPTLTQFGVYELNEVGTEWTQVAKTVNQTSLLEGAAGTTVEKKLEASWAKKAGVRYAIGLLVVSTKVVPYIAGVKSGMPASEMALAPRLSAYVDAEASLPASVAVASLKAVSSIPYFATAP